MPLHTDHRPTSLQDFFGNAVVKEQLAILLERSPEKRPRCLMFTGMSGCLHKDTPIYDPVEGKTKSIYDRWVKNEAFYVISLCPFSGNLVAAPALPPVRYSQDRMFRVRTRESSFCVTPGHRFLLDTGRFLSLRELISQGYGSYRLLSILEPSPTIQPPNVHHWNETLSSFQDGCFVYSRLYDGLPPYLQVAFQEFSPSQADAQEHTHLEYGWKHNHRNQFYGHLSMQDSFPSALTFYQWLEYQFATKISGFADGHNQIALQTPAGFSLQDKAGRFPYLVPGSILGHKAFYSGLEHKLPLAYSPLFHSSLSTGVIIKQVEEQEKDYFYDFHVPFYNNYWAEGLINHNCGKTTLARLYARAIGCDMEQDYHELNIAQIGGKDESGRIQSEMYYMPRSKGSTRVYCLDECHEASRQFFQGMLKATEEPPEHVLFIFCTTDPQKMPLTLKRRAQTYEVKPLAGPEMREFLLSILAKEGIKQFPDEAIDGIVAGAGGSPGIALQYLDQVVDIADDRACIEAARHDLDREAGLDQVMTVLLRKGKFADLAGLVLAMEESTDWEKMRRAMVSWAGTDLLKRGNMQAAVVIKVLKNPIYDTGKIGRAILAACCFEALL